MTLRLSPEASRPLPAATSDIKSKRTTWHHDAGIARAEPAVWHHMQNPPFGKNMVYEDCNLGVLNNSTQHPKYHCNGFGCDACVMKDPTTLLPLGLAFAK